MTGDEDRQDEQRTNFTLILTDGRSVTADPTVEAPSEVMHAAEEFRRYVTAQIMVARDEEGRWLIIPTDRIVMVVAR